MQSITPVADAHRVTPTVRTTERRPANDAASRLCPEEELRLIAAFRAGDARAGDTLLREHRGLVVAIARSYRLWGEPHGDLVQQGLIGLLKAMLRFDADKAQSLRAYAGYWIRAEIRDYVVRTYRIVRLGTTRTERRAMRAFRVHEIRDPEDLAKRSGMPLARCEQLWPLLVRGDAHLDDAYDKYPPLDRVAQEHRNPEMCALANERDADLRAQVSAALSCLSGRERRIVEARMMSDEPCTLEALGIELGLSRERVRQLEVAARAKIRQALAPELAA